MPTISLMELSFTLVKDRLKGLIQKVDVMLFGTEQFKNMVVLKLKYLADGILNKKLLSMKYF